MKGKRLGRLKYDLDNRVSSAVRQALNKDVRPLRVLVEDVRKTLSESDVEALGGVEAVPRRVRSCLELLRHIGVARHEDRVGWVLE